MAIAAGNSLVIYLIRGDQRYSIQLEGQEIRNLPITLVYSGSHYDLLVDTRSEMGRKVADADRAEVTWPSLPRSMVDKAKASKKAGPYDRTGGCGA